MINEPPAAATPEAGMTSEGADAAEQMAAATESLRAKLPLLQGESVPVDPYPA